MKKLLIISSIGAAVLLVLASFTSVVGFQNMKSKSIKESPLFNVRTRQQINEENKDLLICDYLGKGKLMETLPRLEDKFKYLFGIDVSHEKIEELKNTIRNDPLFQQKLHNGQIPQILVDVLELLDIPLESDHPQLATEETACYPYTECEPTKCTDCPCLGEIFYILCLMVVFSFGVTILLVLAFLPIMFILTALGACEGLASINP